VKRKRIGIILVVIGILLALAVGAAVYLQTEQAMQIARQAATVDAVVANVDLPERVAVPAAAVTVVKVPADIMPVNAATKPQDVVGKYPMTTIYKNEVIVKPKLVDTAAKTVPSFTLKEGMVAVTYPGTDLLNATGAIRQGDRVDVLATLPLPRTGGQNGQPGQPGGAPLVNQPANQGPLLPQVTQTVLQNVEVLKVGGFPAAAAQGGQQAEGAGKQITFQVDHQDALILKWVKDSGGMIDLVLRHTNEKEPVATEAITASYVFKKFKFVLADPIQAQ
jgi:pilus assembly protein CpaB